MSEKSVAAKARVKPGTTVALLHPVPGVVESLLLPPDVHLRVDPGSAQLVFLFVHSRGELHRGAPLLSGELRAHTAKNV